MARFLFRHLKGYRFLVLAVRNQMTCSAVVRPAVYTEA
jgi:hypothetical protein